MRKYKLIVLMVTLLGSLIPQMSNAQPYSWTDEQGRICFADDFSQVPEKYKKSAVQIGPSKERKEELQRRRPEDEKNRKAGDTGIQTQRSTEPVQSRQPSKDRDMMEEMARKFPGLSYEWTQDMSLWIRVPASSAYAKEEYSEMAANIASHYHAKKGFLICVRFYYGSGKVIANECR